MELIVLGCSGSGAGPRSAASGYLVRAAGTALAMDLGNGTFGALQRHLDPFELDAVVLSHLHPDHCADVSGLIVHRRYHPQGPGPVLPLHGPSESEVRLAVAYAPSSDERVATDLSDVFRYHVFADGPATIGEVRVSSLPVDHPCEAYGVRLEHGGRALVYSGDTGPCDNLVELAQGADVLLCEATWTDDPDRPPGVHLSGRQAGEAARKAGVGRLLLTHVPAWADGADLLAEAREIYEGPTELVTPDGRYEVCAAPGPTAPGSWSLTRSGPPRARAAGRPRVRGRIESTGPRPRRGAGSARSGRPGPRRPPRRRPR